MCIEFRNLSPIMENEMEKKADSEMDTGVMQGFMGIECRGLNNHLYQFEV